jgi:single-stranded DNA-binding protein
MGDSTQQFKPRSDFAAWVGSGRTTERFESHGGVATAGLAVHSIHGKGEDRAQKTTFIELKAFGKAKDRCLNYGRQGMEVDVVGRLETSEYELEIGGEPIFYDEEEDRPVIMRPLELLVDEIQFKPVSAKKDEFHKDLNVWMGTGRLATRPERHGGVVTFVLAVNAVQKVDDVLVPVTTYYDVKVFGPTGQACLDNLDVGREVSIRGAVETDEYQLKIDDEPVFYDDEQEKPVFMRPLQLLTSRVYFGR